jgi:DNA-binding NarL/FixJ family response regulator
MVRTGSVVINEDAMRETHSEQRYDQGDDLQAGPDGRRSVIPNLQVSAKMKDNVMNDTKPTEQQDANNSDSRTVNIQRLLRERARERAASLRWNIQSVILSYAVLAAVVILSLQGVDLLITVLTAVLGLGVVWLSSWLRIKKFENAFYHEEMDNYRRVASGEASEKSAKGGAGNLTISVDSPLTSRETAVLEQMAEGKSSKQIAHTLQISPQTVKNHISHIFSKLDVTDRTSAVLLALRRGWIKDGHEKL